MQSDPIGLAGGINTYGYVNSDPLGAVDYMGLAGVMLTGGGHTEWGSGNSISAQAESGVGVFRSTGSLWQSPADLIDNLIFWSTPVINAIINYDKSSAGAYTASGETFSYPSARRDNFAVGAYAGLGGGLSITNANCVYDLEGPFDTWTLNTAAVSIKFARDGNTWVLGFSRGVSTPTQSISRYKVTTTNVASTREKSRCGCVNGPPSGT